MEAHWPFFLSSSKGDNLIFLKTVFDWFVRRVLVVLGVEGVDFYETFCEDDEEAEKYAATGLACNSGSPLKRRDLVVGS